MATKPRLLHLISELDVGGTELALVKILPRLQLYFDNHVVCLMGHGKVGKQLSAASIPVHYLNVPHHISPAVLTRAFKLAHKLQPDVIIGNLIQADIVGRLTAARLHRPFISNQRSSLKNRNYLHALDFATQRFVAQYVVQTEYAKNKLQRQGLIPAQKIAIIPNLVEEAQSTTLRSQTRQTLNIPDEAIVITCVSNLRAGKGQTILLKAMAKIYQLPATSYQLQTLFIGDGPERPELEALSRKLGLTENVHFLGLRRDIPDLLAASDIFVLPSEAEGMSNALLEAMAAGLPCVASDIPANRVVVTDHRTGLLFPTNDAAKLASAIQTLAANPSLRQRLGAAAAHYTQNHHAPQHITNQWRAVLLKTLL